MFNLQNDSDKVSIEDAPKSKRSTMALMSNNAYYMKTQLMRDNETFQKYVKRD